MDRLEEVTCELVALLRRAGATPAPLIYDIEETLRLDGSGGALPLAISEVLAQQLPVPEHVITALRSTGDPEDAGDADELEKVSLASA